MCHLCVYNMQMVKFSLLWKLSIFEFIKHIIRHTKIEIENNDYICNSLGKSTWKGNKIEARTQILFFKVKSQAQH